MIMVSNSEEAQPESRSFREQPSVLEQAMPGAAREAQPLLSLIYQSASQVHEALRRIDVTPVLPRSVTTGIRCFECGTGKMESFHTSKQGGYHLCPTCFQHRVRTGRA
jgi:hypothetical protein